MPGFFYPFKGKFSPTTSFLPNQHIDHCLGIQGNQMN
jgi:hypothetical protein